MSGTIVDFDPLNRFRLDDRVAVVTGASGGLGARFARVLDAAGAAVVLAARREDELQAQARQLRYMTGQVVVVDGGYIAL
jgi:NADP-dependent 3-hydroxy acid dehydrogenase YdfG